MLQESDIKVQQMPAFKRVYKKSHSQERTEVDKAVLAIIQNPKIGEEKKGDLAGIFVYQFKIHHQELLLAYEWDEQARILLALGVHENFYRNLKIH